MNGLRPKYNIETCGHYMMILGIVIRNLGSAPAQNDKMLLTENDEKTFRILMQQ